MQVILLENIINLGKIGDIVKVKDGYARNFLLPNNRAIRKNPENIKKLEEQRKEIEKNESIIKKEAEEKILKLNKIKIKFIKESDENGQLYGSIQAKEILQAIKEQSIEIKAENLIIRKQIRSVGDHEIEINPYHNLTTKVIISVNSMKKE